MYQYYEFGAKVYGTKNIYLADRKIRKWKNKYIKKVKCEHCGNAPCCLEHMGALLYEEGEAMYEREDIQNCCICYHLYRIVARNYFGYIGWLKKNDLPKYIVNKVRRLYPRGYSTDFADFIKDDKFHTGIYNCNY